MTLNENNIQLNGDSLSYSADVSIAPKDALDTQAARRPPPTLLSEFLKSHKELQSYR